MNQLFMIIGSFLKLNSDVRIRWRNLRNVTWQTFMSCNWFALKLFILVVAEICRNSSCYLFFSSSNKCLSNETIFKKIYFLINSIFHLLMFAFQTLLLYHLKICHCQKQKRLIDIPKMINYTSYGKWVVKFYIMNA